MKQINTGYALRSPGGHLVAETFSHNRADCWFRSYDFLGNIVPSFHKRYYKRLEASQAWARRHGWRMVKVKLHEIL